MADTQIVPLILDRVVAHLTVKLIDEITDVNEKASVVEIGRFQDDPTKQNIHIAVQGGHVDKPEFMDGIVTLEEFHRIGVWVPAYEVGGGQLWWRRFTANIGCFYIGKGLTEAVARVAAHNVFGRLQAHIDDVVVSDLSDSFGESAYKTFAYASEFHQGGGPPKEYIWRGRVSFQTLTTRVPLPT